MIEFALWGLGTVLFAHALDKVVHAGVEIVDCMWWAKKRKREEAQEAAKGAARGAANE